MTHVFLGTADILRDVFEKSHWLRNKNFDIIHYIDVIVTALADANKYPHSFTAGVLDQLPQLDGEFDDFDLKVMEDILWFMYEQFYFRIVHADLYGVDGILRYDELFLYKDDLILRVH